MTEADVLAKTYKDTCIIERISDVEDPVSHITEQKYEPTHEKPIACAFSQTGLGPAGGLAVVESADMLNVTVDEYRLFLRPEIKVEKGDRITVAQATSNQTFALYAKQPFYYVSHCEVNLTGRDPNG